MFFLEKYIPKPENATYVFESGKAYNVGCLQLILTKLFI